MRRTIEKIKERKGITLIALAVTIVVILILAGITVGMVTSDNGILKETKNAKQQAEIDNEKSIVERAKMLAMMRSKNGAITYEIFEPAIKDEAGKISTDVSDAGDTIEVLFKESNRYYEIDQDGNVSEPQEVVKDEYAGDITKGGRCDGSEEKPYEINCIEDLVVLSNIVNGNGIKFENGQAVKITTRENFANKNIILTRSLNFKSKYSYKDSTRTDFGDINGDDTDGNSLMTEMTTGTGFTPIGSVATYFCGNFNGNNYSIANILIIVEEKNKSTGFFGGVQNGAVIEKLTITGKIESKINHTGGIIGECTNDHSCIIKNCTNKASITGLNSVGGIIGYNGGNSTAIENCKNYGNIYIIDGSYGYTGAGGITGSSVKEIMNCQNYGIIRGNYSVGGIAGYMSPSDGIIKNCLNTGEVKSEFVGATGNAGGIVGKTSGGNWKIQNCINTGNVSGNGVNGGIIGSVRGQGWGATIDLEIENSINMGDVSSTNSSVGGIIGEQWDVCKRNYITIKNSVALCKVNGSRAGGTISAIAKNTDSCDVKTIFENVYYIKEPAIKSGSLTSGEATLKTETEIKSQAFVDLLNSNIGTNTDWKKWKLGNDGYPTFTD